MSHTCLTPGTESPPKRHFRANTGKSRVSGAQLLVRWYRKGGLLMWLSAYWFYWGLAVHWTGIQEAGVQWHLKNDGQRGGSLCDCH
jgi:hypothetical protein